MKKFIIIFMTCILLAFTVRTAFAEEAVNIIVLNGTNETKDGFPVYEEGGDKKAFMDIYNKSFIKKSIELYSIAAKQYSDLKEQDLYVAFRENSGCYGRIGFYLKKDGILYDKTKSPYIELSKGHLKGNYDRLGSITQMFPHEMGHVISEITAFKDKDINQTSTNIHYSNIITEYNLAFNEGFGEHFEVISRMYEDNEQIKNGIYEDISRTKSNIGNALNSGNRDFLLPLRLDYYRETSLLWQQKYENLKRHELGLNGDGRYKNLSYNFKDVEKTILYRNMGLFQNKSEIRNLEQSLSTEIVISNFFVKLITTDKGSLNDKYSKVFNVFNKYVNKDNTAQLIQFVKGYIREYPEDKDRVLNIFKESTGHDFQEEATPEIWAVSEGEHINLIMDQFSGLKFPFHIFNINTCEKEDLLKLKGMNEADAEKIVAYRDKNKGFKEVKEFENIEGISNNTVQILYTNTSKEKIQNINSQLDNINLDSSFTKLFGANIKHLIFKTIIWFCIFSLVYYLLIMKAVIKYNKGLLGFAIKKFFKFILYVLIGLISVFCGNVYIVRIGSNLNPIIVFILFIFICEAITLLVVRKDKIKVKDSIISSLMMALIILYSIY